MATLKQVPTQNSLQYTLDAGYTSGGTVLTLSSTLTGIIQAPGVCVVDRVDSSGNRTATKRDYFTFTGVSGATLTGCVGGLAGSTNQDHAVGAIVEFVPDILWAQAVYDVITAEHSTAGVHDNTKVAMLAGAQTFTGAKTFTTGLLKAVDITSGSGVNTLPTSTTTLVGRDTTDTLTNKTLTAPKIASGGFIADANGNEQIIFTTTASAVNEITVTNGSTGVSPQIKSSGETNLHLEVVGKGNGFTKISVLNQSDTTDAYSHKAIFLTGWGFILGDTSSDLSETVTWGITATSVLSVTIAFIGYKDNSDPTAITDFTGGYFAATCSAQAIGTTGFTAVVQDTNNTGIANTRRMGYSWTAVCTLT